MEVWNKKTRRWENTKDQKKLDEIFNKKGSLNLEELKALHRAELSKPDYNEEYLDYLEKEILKEEKGEKNIKGGF